MEPSADIIDSLYVEKVLRARAVPMEEKLHAGYRLFQYACEIMKMGIRHQHPDASPEQVNLLLKQRLALADTLEEQIGE